MAGRRPPPQNRRPSRADHYHGQRYESRTEQRRDGQRRSPSPRGSETRHGSDTRRRNPSPPPPRRRIKLPARRGMTFSSKTVVGLFFIFVVAYMVIRAYGIFTPNVDITILRLGNIEMQQSVPGVIIREETVFHANRDGRIVFDVQEFDHVREGVLVASIRNIEAVNQNEQDMALLHQEIRGVHEMRHGTTSDPLIERANANLQSRMDRSMHHHMQMNLPEIYSLLDTITQITYNRNRMITSESVEARSDLSRRHEFLEAQREMNSSDIYATHSGIMSPIIDGFEDLFTPRNMNTLNREQVRMRIDHEAIIPGREVMEGDEVFKIVRNTWYVATWMPNEMARGFTVGTERPIYLENAVTGRFERVPMRVEHIDNAHRDTFVIFRSTRNVIEFLNQRSVNIRITDSVQNGFMIPASAIATRRFFRIPLTHVHGAEEFFIMHRREDGIQPVPIDIHERTETCAFILEDNLTFLQEGSLVPVDPADLIHIISDADMRIVRGVYRTTLNFAEFREVNIEGEVLDAGGPIMLDPARNPNIRQFDSIVTDASMVRQGQVVR